MAYSMHKRQKDRHRLVLRNMRRKTLLPLFLSPLLMPEDKTLYQMYRRYLDRNQYGVTRAGSKRYTFYKRYFHRIDRQARKRMEHLALHMMEQEMEGQVSGPMKNRLWYMIW